MIIDREDKKMSDKEDEKVSYILGLDLGISSFGYSGITPCKDKKEKILFTHTQMFDAAEHPKTGASLASPRREKRGQRVRLKRRAKRKQDIRHLLIKHGFSKKDVATINTPASKDTLSVWQLRSEALERLLTDDEMARVLFYIAKRRGYQSNKKGETDQNKDKKNEKKALKGMEALTSSFNNSRARTIGSYLASQEKQRNNNNEYSRLVTRDQLREEVDIIFEEQHKRGNKKLTPEMKQEYKEVSFTQNPIRSSYDLVGLCTLEQGEKRAPKNSIPAEKFVLWSKLHNLKIKNINGKERSLKQEEKEIIEEMSRTLKKINYNQIRKKLKLLETERFNISYTSKKSDKTSEGIEKSTTFIEMKAHNALKTALKNSSISWETWTTEHIKTLNKICEILSFNADIILIKDELSKLDIPEEDQKELATISSFKGTVNLSFKAISKVIQPMISGKNFYEACQAEGYKQDKKNKEDIKKDIKIPPIPKTNNPVVNRALAHARKALNAIFLEHGLPEKIIIELARDIAKPQKGYYKNGKYIEGRKDIEKKIEDNQKAKESAKEAAKEILNINIKDNNDISETEILHFRLWQEQKHLCVYCGVKIEAKDLKDAGALEVDHILPKHRSWDNSYNNKTLCHTRCNQTKGDRTPYEWIKNGNNTFINWDMFVTYIKDLPYQKRRRMLLEKLDEKAWKDRNLNDTRYITTHFANHLRKHLALSEGNIQTRNGALTSHLRKSWGFPDKDRTNDRHHALDALILACSTQDMVTKFANWNKYQARSENKKPKPPTPWDGFREDALKAIEKMFVIRLPSKKITGPAHEATINSIKEDHGGLYTVTKKIKLSKLTTKHIENLVDKEGRNKNLYNILKPAVEDYEIKLAIEKKKQKKDQQPVEHPFKNPIKLIGKKGAEKAATIHSVTIEEEKSGIKINKGLASNGDMIRVDVFKKGKKYYYIPIYVHHYALKALPYHPAAEKPDIDVRSGGFEFLFSLYKNDYIRLKTKEGEEIEGYYNSFDISGAGVIMHAHDKDPSFAKAKEEKTKKEEKGKKEKKFTRKFGGKELQYLEKYTVTLLGEKHKVKKEKRLPLHKKQEVPS